VSPDPYIRDAAFRGSPILSYGTARRGSAWPKFLALGAGIFVLLILAVFSWFWFFTSIPVPKGDVMNMVLPAQTSLNVSSPLVWKQTLELNKPMPTIVGLVKDAKESRGYAVRLAPATAVVGKTRLWQLESEKQLDIVGYKTPYEVFGWPWDLLNKERHLRVAIRDLFSEEDLIWEDFPDNLEGEVVGNRWKTNLPVLALKGKSSKEISDSGFVRLEEGGSDILQNFLNYHGAWVRTGGSGDLVWNFDPSMVTIDYRGEGELGNMLGLVDDRSSLITRDFVLEDETVVKRLYMMPLGASSTGVVATQTSLGIVVEQSGMGIDSKSVSGLTCEGEVLASFNRQSIQNFCSWIDICYFDFDNIVLLNEGGYLTACGY
jgi:hypothetical protein